MSEDSSALTYTAIVALILGVVFVVAMVVDCPVSP
jgi:hypothetical protein